MVALHGVFSGILLVAIAVSFAALPPQIVTMFGGARCGWLPRNHRMEGGELMATQAIAIRPRSLANVLADLRHACEDYDEAIDKISGSPDDADLQDRATEAETRQADLREEFSAKLLEATGLTLETLLAARERCLL